MTIIAYASGVNTLPNESPPVSYTQTSDPVVTLANTNLPSDINIYGNAVDSADNAPVFTWAWSIVSQTHQSPAISLSGGGTIQSPVVQAINTWGNTRCFLVATNATSGATSETDPLRAPDSAFVTIRVRSAGAALQKIAAGERNWNNDADEWVQAIEDIHAGANGLPAHTLTQHSDVTTSTGVDLDALTGGGYANDPDAVTPNANGALHIHTGPQVDEATRVARGTIKIENAAGPARAINVEKMVLTASITSTQRDDGVVIQRILPYTLGAIANSPSSEDLATWYLAYMGLTIRRLFVTMGDGGTSVPGVEPYTFDLAIGNAAAFTGKAMVRQNIDITGTPAVSNAPFTCGNDVLNIAVQKDDFIGFRCVNGPSKDGEQGGLLTVTLILDREAQ